MDNQNNSSQTSQNTETSSNESGACDVYERVITEIDSCACDVYARVMTEIAEKGNCADLVTKAVIETLVQEQLDKNAELLKDALKRYNDTLVELSKIKPKPMGFGEDGKPISMAYSPDDHNKQQGLQKKIGKLGSAINQALKTGDYTKLSQG